jgi:ATP-dependent Lhr-like helicase
VRTGEGAYWFAAEQLRAIEVLYTRARVAPPVQLPPSLDGPPPEREDAVRAAVRGHMEHAGPVAPAALAVLLSFGEGEVISALARLEGEGVVLRGRFTPGADAGEEFCDRRLLARVHRYTLDRLRSEIEPVSAQDYMRYLLQRHRAGGGRRMEGKRGLLDAIAQLQGFEIPAVAWERDVLPVRVANYDPRWLDDLCLAGEVAWLRLSARKPGNGTTRGAGASRATPITLALRRDLRTLVRAARGDAAPDVSLSGAAADVYDALREHGALFFDDLAAASRVLPAQLEDALWELVGRGLVTSDGFSALRQIMSPRRAGTARNGRRHSRYGAARLARAAAPQGRWAIVRSVAAAPTPADELAEASAAQLLSRYGVVFRDVVARENIALPWREIVRALRRQEARGVVRGGRFVAGFVGEQYALPEAVDALRRVRKQERGVETVRLSACDPLNLAGIILPGPRMPALQTNALVLRDGLPVADGADRVEAAFAPAAPSG